MKFPKLNKVLNTGLPFTVNILFYISVFFFVFIQTDKAFAQDLDLNSYTHTTFNNFSKINGQILTTGFYHSASVHRLGGIDLGLKMMIGYIPDENRFGPLNDNTTITVPAFQANVGLIKGFEAGVRYFSFSYGDENKEKVNLYSGMLKYNVLSGLAFPDITLFSAYTRLTGISDFTINAISLGGIIGKSLPLLTVYAGGNYSSVTMDIDIMPDSGLYPSGLSSSIRENITHFTLGIALGLAPFTKLNLEYNIGEIQSGSLGIVLSIF